MSHPALAPASHRVLRAGRFAARTALRGFALPSPGPLRGLGPAARCACMCTGWVAALLAARAFTRCALQRRLRVSGGAPLAFGPRLRRPLRGRATAFRVPLGGSLCSPPRDHLLAGGSAAALGAFRPGVARPLRGRGAGGCRPPAAIGPTAPSLRSVRLVGPPCGSPLRWRRGCAPAAVDHRPRSFASLSPIGGGSSLAAPPKRRSLAAGLRPLCSTTGRWGALWRLGPPASNRLPQSLGVASGGRGWTPRPRLCRFPFSRRFCGSVRNSPLNWFVGQHGFRIAKEPCRNTADDSLSS